MSKAAILCVDDEVVVLNSLKIQLKREFGDAYVYEVAESADEALEIIDELQSEETDILVIVSDWLMPGIKGDEFLIRVHEKYPKIIKVMLTGQADETAIQRAKEKAALHNCLYKPWSSQELIATIKSGLEGL
ncbi:response regulator [Phormidium sp. LEGE 05292]|uniref:response regulator n=1 Tax=[Phormidium] sp. LEGE 05292 TaxID=767427 RepID=UPI00187E1615|nr:response regulator [Phormidium sp. LEGE 05292]MBE9223867.1 response regulator [Phormidium sp. LEGE 05292]